MIVRVVVAVVLVLALGVFGVEAGADGPTEWSLVHWRERGLKLASEPNVLKEEMARQRQQEDQHPRASRDTLAGPTEDELVKAFKHAFPIPTWVSPDYTEFHALPFGAHRNPAGHRQLEAAPEIRQLLKQQQQARLKGQHDLSRVLLTIVSFAVSTQRFELGAHVASAALAVMPPNTSLMQDYCQLLETTDRIHRAVQCLFLVVRALSEEPQKIRDDPEQHSEAVYMLQRLLVSLFWQRDGDGYRAAYDAFVPVIGAPWTNRLQIPTKFVSGLTSQPFHDPAVSAPSLLQLEEHYGTIRRELDAYLQDHVVDELLFDFEIVSVYVCVHVCMCVCV